MLLYGAKLVHLQTGDERTVYLFGGNAWLIAESARSLYTDYRVADRWRIAQAETEAELYEYLPSPLWGTLRPPRRGVQDAT